MPIGTVGNPLNIDFTNPENPPSTRARQVRANMREIHYAFPEGDFNGKFNLSVNHQFRYMGSEQFSGRTVYFYQRNGEIKLI